MQKYTFSNLPSVFLDPSSHPYTFENHACHLQNDLLARKTYSIKPPVMMALH